PPPPSRKRYVLEFEFQGNRDHLARGLVDQLVIRRLARRIDEEVLEAKLAAVGAGVGKAAIVLEAGSIGSLEPESVVEQSLAIALEGRPLSRVRQLDVDLPDLFVHLGPLEGHAHVALLDRHMLLGQARELEDLDAG